MQGAWSVLAYHRGNPVEALLGLFPEIGLQRAKFTLRMYLRGERTEEYMGREREDNKYRLAVESALICFNRYFLGLQKQQKKIHGEVCLPQRIRPSGS